MFVFAIIYTKSRFIQILSRVILCCLFIYIMYYIPNFRVKVSWRGIGTATPPEFMNSGS